MTAIISKHGQLLFTIQGSNENVLLNIPPDGFAVDEPPNSNMYYVEGNWVDMPAQPTAHHTFNYETKLWIDERSIDTAKDHHWQKIKTQRDTFEFGGFAYDGNVYDSDQVSQARILVAAASGLPQSWTTADNSVIELTTEEIQALANSMQTHISEAHELGRIAREAINAAQSIEEIEAVTL